MQNEVQVIVPVGMFGASDADSMLDKILREIAVAACDPDGDDWFPMGTPERNAAKYGVKVENDVFLMCPDYMDVECECGHRERAEAFHEADGPHADLCYDSVRRARIEAWEALHPEPKAGCDIFIVNGKNYDNADEAWAAHMAEAGSYESRRSSKAELDHKAWCEWYEQKSNAEDNISHGLCAELGIPWDDGRGSAVHCTCGKDERVSAWFAINKHELRCPVVLPNFWFKPTDLRVEWYKYIGRDVETNRPIELAELVAIHDQCLKSLQPSLIPTT